MTAETDLRILAEMADKLNQGGSPLGLSALLLRNVQTKQGTRVAQLIAHQSRQLVDANYQLKWLRESHEKQLGDLRDEMQRLTDAMLEMEKRCHQKDPNHSV